MSSTPPGDIPPATPATPDLICWLWAAFPPRNGQLHTARIAQALGVSQRTIQRWTQTQTQTPHLTRAQTAALHRRAILRGRGTYLWPDLDPATLARHQAQLTNAQACLDLILDDPTRTPPAWRTNTYLQPYTLTQVYYPKAHVYGVSINHTKKAIAKLHNHGDVISEITLPERFTALIAKHEILHSRSDARCITPRGLVPIGHTDTWRAAGGPVDVRAWTTPRSQNTSNQR